MCAKQSSGANSVDVWGSLRLPSAACKPTELERLELLSDANAGARATLLLRSPASSRAPTGASSCRAAGAARNVSDILQGLCSCCGIRSDQGVGVRGPHQGFTKDHALPPGPHSCTSATTTVTSSILPPRGKRRCRKDPCAAASSTAHGVLHRQARVQQWCHEPRGLHIVGCNRVVQRWPRTWRWRPAPRCAPPA